MVTPNPLKILMVDDHPLIRQGLRALLAELAEDVQVLESGDFPQALALIDANPDIDLILLDLQLPSTVGLSALIDIHEFHAEIPVAVISGFTDKATVLGAYDRGASGYIPKSSSPATLLEAIRVVLGGGLYIPPEATIQANVLQDQAHDILPVSSSLPLPESVRKMGLSARQLEIVALILQGKPNKAICRELGMSLGAVKNHVAAILREFKVSNRTQIIVTVLNQRRLESRPDPRLIGKSKLV